MNPNATILAAFVPQEDITAFELALIYANVGTVHPPKNGVIFGEAQWEELDTRIKRHFIAQRPVPSNHSKNLQGETAN